MTARQSASLVLREDTGFSLYREEMKKPRHRLSGLFSSAV
jgi:hypothetical protein